MNRRPLLVTIPLITLVLAACSSVQGPALTAAETGTAIADLYQAGVTVGSAAGWHQLPVDALGAVAGIALPVSGTPGALPRGKYSYDSLSKVWVKTAESDDLELAWLHDAVAYGLVFDWDATAPTITVAGPGSETAEVPTGAAATLSQGGTPVGGLAASSNWVTNKCAVDEPSRASLSGYLAGDGALLTLDRLGFTLADTAGTDTITTEAEVTASVGGDSLSAYLELSGNGTLERDVDCNIVDFAPVSGTVALGAAATVAGDSHSVDFETALSDPQYSGDVLTGIGLAGSLRLDGVLATSFSGSLNDANANGIPGDELKLTFADDQTTTLEEFLIDHIVWGLLTALRMMTR